MVNKNFPLVSTNTSDKTRALEVRKCANSRPPAVDWERYKSARPGPPPPQGCRARNRLLIIADATAEMSVRPGYEAYLRNERIIGAGLWAHIADLGDLTVRLLNRRIDFHAKRSARRVLSGAYVHAKRLLEVGIASCNDRAIAGANTKHVEVSIPESAFSLVEHIERFGLIRSRGGACFYQHGPGFVGRSAGLLSERNTAGAAGITNLRTIAFLLSRAPTKGPYMPPIDA